MRREQGKPMASRDHRFDIRQTGDPLIQRLDQIAVDMEEEDILTVVDVAVRARAAFDLDKVTKRFYDRFKNEHAAFLKLIKGFPKPQKVDGKEVPHPDLQWYTSLMLNRLMFVYFIQKKGFLDGDTEYLRNRLKMIQQARGKDKFLSFYRYFLLRLFHDGLGKAPDERKLDAAIEKLLGKVPFLNGGFFEVHDLEQRYSEIDIPDNAFEKLFDFFDQYRWHLDERPLRADNEINPDVVGYIFEKYINQKQMGAYYTKEDITGYISKNTIIPYLFDAAQKKCAIAFEPNSALWRLLRDNPDRYIYPAVRHGVIKDDGTVIPESALPDFVRNGMHDPKVRMHDSRYNLQQATAEDELRLVTETWREYVYRRNRCLEMREKLFSGEVHAINEMVTFNLDIWQFARDAIVHAEGPELLRAFWDAIIKVTVLDPTCGSGAFLFAALRILETLYSDCLERMERFIEDITDKPHHPEQYSDFNKVLAQLAKHHNERYFVLKSIIINNLFGVDIMEEAVEICKLRLFLKLVAQVEKVEQMEPLPDIDFNIRAGNTLVGYATANQVRKAFTEERKSDLEVQSKLLLDSSEDDYKRFEESVELVERAFRQYRIQQTTYGGKITHKDKQNLRKRLAELNIQLDRNLANEYGITPKSYGSKSAYEQAFLKWKESHQPFHWFVEFYGIMSTGGFDVIIGNPPYLELRQVEYTPRLFKTLDSGAIHAMCVERSAIILNSRGAMSMIVPLALVSTQRMVTVQKIIENNAYACYANFAWRPGKLFDTVNRALTIFVSLRGIGSLCTFSTNYQKWNSDARSDLITTMAFCGVLRDRLSFWVPKLGQQLEQSILTKLFTSKTHFANFIGQSENLIYYRTTGGLYWKVFTNFAPAFKCNGKIGHSSRETTLHIIKTSYVKAAIAVLSSNFYWWWYTITSNLRDLNPSDINLFPIHEAVLADKKLSALGENYLNDLKQNSMMLIRQQRQTGRTETQSFKIQKSKSIIDKVDGALAQHYCFTDEELDFIINYDIKYRMGNTDDENGDDE